METLLRVALDQALALLVAALVVTYVAPTTKGGAIVLFLVAFATVVLIKQAIRFIWQVAGRKKVSMPPPNTGSTAK